MGGVVKAVKSVFGSFMDTKKDMPKPAAVAPAADEKATADARRRMLAARAQQGSREGTVLSDTFGG